MTKCTGNQLATYSSSYCLWCLLQAPLIIGDKVVAVYVTLFFDKSEKLSNTTLFLFVILAAPEVNEWVMTQLASSTASSSGG